MRESVSDVPVKQTLLIQSVFVWLFAQAFVQHSKGAKANVVYIYDLYAFSGEIHFPPEQIFHPASRRCCTE